MTRPVALVTGARRGIGRAVCLALAARGFDVAFTDVVEDEAVDEVGAALGEAGAEACFIRHDVTALDTHEALIADVTAWRGRLDCFVSNAGIGAPVRGDPLALTPERFDMVMGVNLRGALFLSQAVARAMLAGPKAPARSLVFITSVSATLMSPERADYCISKTGLAAWARALALRLAPEDIAVFDVRPGIIRTAMTEPVAEAYTARIAEGLVPAGRWGEPEDVGRLVAALAAGDFAFASGSVIACDGALSAARL